jgi:2-polyprenyl-3-methyl-5-hydroxy-6-metoxy-1,4-benzoquinol methylase
MGSAEVQGQIWGVRARDWAEVQEGLYAPLFEVILRETAVGAGTELLDVGCGSGMFCQMAARLGARVSGLDAAEPFLAIARERVPQGDFRTGEMEELPYADRTFDVVTGNNAFQFAASPVKAIHEAARVARPGGSLVIAIFGRREDTEAVAYFAGLGSLLPPPPGASGPFAFSSDGALEALVTQAGLHPVQVEEVDCPWEYPDAATLLRGLLSTGPSMQAIQIVGEEATSDAILNALAPFKTASGGYRLRNQVRYMIAKT